MAYSPCPGFYLFQLPGSLRIKVLYVCRDQRIKGAQQGIVVEQKLAGIPVDRRILGESAGAIQLEKILERDSCKDAEPLCLSRRTPCQRRICIQDRQYGEYTCLGAVISPGRDHHGPYFFFDAGLQRIPPCLNAESIAGGKTAPFPGTACKDHPVGHLLVLLQHGLVPFFAHMVIVPESQLHLRRNFRPAAGFCSGRRLIVAAVSQVEKHITPHLRLQMVGLAKGQNPLQMLLQYLDAGLVAVLFQILASSHQGGLIHAYVDFPGGKNIPIPSSAAYPADGTSAHPRPAGCLRYRGSHHTAGTA